MSLVVCEACSTRYPPDVEHCPQCGSGAAVAEEVAEQRRPLLAVRVVACVNTACPAVGIARRIPLRHAGPGVFERPMLVCARCRHEMADVETTEEEDSVAKISAHGGPTDANADDADQAVDPEQAEQVELAAGEDAGGDDASGDDEQLVADYEAWTVEQLRAELGERGEATTGKKAELIERLTDADDRNAPVTENS
jgi:hypothetical protein